MNIEDIEAVIKPLMLSSLGGSIVRDIARKVHDTLKDRWILDEVAKGNLRELQQHCRAIDDLVNRLLSQ